MKISHHAGLWDSLTITSQTHRLSARSVGMNCLGGRARMAIQPYSSGGKGLLRLSTSALTQTFVPCLKRWRHSECRLNFGFMVASVIVAIGLTIRASTSTVWRVRVYGRKRKSNPLRSWRKILATAGSNVLRAATSGRESPAAVSTCVQAVANLRGYEIKEATHRMVLDQPMG
jgi:hypothetical protein